MSCRVRELALLLCLSGCAAQSFQPHFKTRALPTERDVLAQISTLKPRDERPVAVGITSDPMRLFAWDLSAGLLWERPINAKSAPLVVADAIVLQEERGITVRELASGEVRVVVDEEGQLIGADGEGHSLVISISYGGEDAHSAVAYVQGRQVRWMQSLRQPVGTPALVNGRVLVPWATQRLSVLQAQDGAELVRWHMNNTVFGQALVDRGRVYAGQLGLMRLDQHLLQPGATPVVYAPFKRSLPGQPPLLRDGYAVVPEPANAQHRLQVDWRMGAGDPMSSENDLLMLRFYRLLFALDAREDAIRWVRTFDHDLIGAAIEPGGLFVADSAGTLRFLDVDGATRMQRDLGRSLQVLAIRPGGWVPSVAPTAAQPAQPAAPAAAGAVAASTPAAGEAPLPSLREQLFAAAALDDDRISAGRAYAVEHLALIADESVTTHLIDLCANRKSPQPVNSAACMQLAKRPNGGEQVIQTLRRRASFLEGTEPPPVGALAQAAGQMQLKQAAPLLLSHMDDPNTPAAELPAVLETLERLGHRPAATAIERFVRLHHAEPQGSELAPALFAAIHALGTLRVRSSRAGLEELSRDPLTPAQVRDKAREALAALDAPAAAAGKPEPATPAKPEPEEAESESDEVQTDPRPYSLSAEIVREALKPARAKLSACLGVDPATPRAGRVSMVVSGDGRVEGIFVTPTTLQACMEPALHDVKFPATRLGRQRITHIVNGANATKTVKPDATKRGGKPDAAKQPGAAKPGAGKRAARKQPAPAAAKP